jgi:hypothetical protein
MGGAHLAQGTNEMRSWCSSSPALKPAQTRASLVSGQRANQHIARRVAWRVKVMHFVITGEKITLLSHVVAQVTRWWGEIRRAKRQTHKLVDEDKGASRPFEPLALRGPRAGALG